MYCPKCSQQQTSEDVRFCSRCGFQMHVVAHLLETNGALAGFEPEEPENVSLYKRITSSAGAKLVFISIVIAIFLFIIAIFTNTPQILVLPFFLFVIGTAMIIYKLLFGGKTNAAEADFYKPKNLNQTKSSKELPPIQSIAANIYESPRRETGELRQPPPSVTEPTTKLLGHESGKTNEL